MRKKNIFSHLIHVRPRLVAAVVFGLLAALIPYGGLYLTHFLIGWNVGVWTYLLLIFWLMARAAPSQVRAIAAREDETAEVVLAFMCVAALISLVAIVLELAAVKSMFVGSQLAHYSLTGGTLLGSWLLVNVMFTLHYAHMYFTADEACLPMLFPDRVEVKPDYWDFLYFSFTIAVAAQTSDISVMTSEMRKVVVAQSVLSFLFNAAIIGLSINVAAGLIGS
jgi:uncharacterized membrane protein